MAGVNLAAGCTPGKDASHIAFARLHGHSEVCRRIFVRRQLALPTVSDLKQDPSADLRVTHVARTLRRRRRRDCCRSTRFAASRSWR